MIHLHMVLQGKGGVGKSLIASFLAQHFQNHDLAPICIDTDPVNATFAGYAALNVTRLDIVEGEEVNHRAFDKLFEQIISAPDDSVFVIDNGATSFLPICLWMVENSAIKSLQDNGVEVVLHSVLTGGQSMIDALMGLDSLFKHFKETPIVVWLNEYYGKTENDQGKSFEEGKLFKENVEAIRALITIPQRRKETFGFDFNNLLRKKTTFKEAQADKSLNLFARQRLKTIWDDIDTQLTAANL